MRRKLYDIIEASNQKYDNSWKYDIFMIITIIVSLVPLTVKYETSEYRILDLVCACIFIVDYFFRWSTADFKLKRGKLSFVLYPFTFMALVDLVSIVPSLIVAFNNAFRLLRIFRLIRALRVVRVIRLFRYSKNVMIIGNVIKKTKDALSVVALLCVGYIIVTALIIFCVEPWTFETFFDALYWATVSLTTIGYGDIYATSAVGRVITMLSALIGVAVIAFPSGIITAAYLLEINLEKTLDDDEME